MTINRITAAREAKGMSMAMLASKIGASVQHMYRLERGQRRLTLEWIEKIAPALGMSGWELLPDSPAPDSPLSDLIRTFQSLDENRRTRLLDHAKDLLAAQTANRPLA